MNPKPGARDDIPRHQFWEYDETVRSDPTFQVAAAQVTEFGSLGDRCWLISTFVRDRIRHWLMTVRVVSCDRKSVNLMCVLAGTVLTQVRLSPKWIL